MSEPRPAAVPACLFAWLLPGAGHLYLGKRGRGLAFLGAILALFVLGVAMEARLRPPETLLDDPLLTITSLAQAAVGVPYFLARAAAQLGPDFFLHLNDAGRITAVSYEYGNTFTAAAGLLNILLILDAYDLAVGRKA